MRISEELAFKQDPNGSIGQRQSKPQGQHQPRCRASKRMVWLVDVREFQRTFSSGARVTSFIKIGIGDGEMPQ